jgi:hypothetical protein
MKPFICVVLGVVLAVGCGTDDGGGDPAPVDASDGQSAVDTQDTSNADTSEPDGDVCVADCAGLECGDDGCGGTCGDCPMAAPVCSDDQLCVPECVAQCDGPECGDDGCGGSCGDCPVAAPVCSDDQLCVPDVCVAQCDGLDCGDDGCGGSCGDCPMAAPVCSDDQLCVPDECVAQCDGLECGDDGCGGSCGECLEPTPVCDAAQKCVPCVPDCDGKTCGDDGCGSSCGACDDHASCEGTNLTSYSAGVCAKNGTMAACEYAETVSDCADDGEVCVAAQCAPTDPNDFVFGSASSLITKLDIVGAVSGETCCFDLDDDGEADNTLGALLASLGALWGGEEPEGPLDTGGLITLLNYEGLDDITDDATLEVHAFYGGEQLVDESDVLAGTAQLTVDPMSFISGTGVPKTSFETASIAAGAMVADASQFLIAFHIGGLALITPVTDARLVADLTIGPDGVGPQFQDAKFGGYLRMADLYASMNSGLADSCACLGLDNGLYLFDETNQKASCANILSSTCDEEDSCSVLAEACLLSVGVLKGDLDSDDDGVMDAMSVGAWVSATSATITGLVTE